MTQITNFDRDYFDSRPRIKVKLWLFEVCIHLQCLPKKFYGHTGYVDDPLPSIVHIAVWVPACIVCMHPARLCGCFRTIFSA